MTLTTVISMITLILKFATLLMEKTGKTPIEKRAEALADLDAALIKAKATKDLSDLSNQLGRGI